MIRAVGIVSLAALMLVLGGAWFVLGTTSGTVRLLDFGAGWLPGELELAEVDGSLSTRVRVGRLVYRQEELVVVAKNVGLDVNLRQLLKGKLAIEGLEADSVTLNEAGVDLRMQLAGTVRLAADLPLEVTVEWADRPTGVQGRGKFNGTLSQLDFKHVAEFPDAVRIDGVIHDIVDTPSVAADVRWDELSLPEQEFGALVARNGEAYIEATLDDYRFTANAEFVRDEDQQLMAAIAAHGDTEKLVIDSLELEGLGGALGATGTIGFGELPAVLLAVSASDFNPGVLLPGYDGRLTFKADVDARWPERLSVRVPQLEGEFLDSPVRGTGSVLAANGVLQRADAQLRSGMNELQVSVSGQPQLVGDFRINAPELASIWPGLAGSVVGRGKISGTRAAPNISIDLSGEDISYDAQAIANLRVVGQANVESGVDFKAGADGLQLGGQPIGNLTVNGSGTLEAHTFDVHLSGGLLATRFDVAGSWDGEMLGERMSNATIDTDLGTWRLRESLEVETDGGALIMTAHCWDNSPASICVDALEAREDRLTAGAVIEQFPLQLLNPWLSEGVALEGEANATLSFERGADGFNTTVDWKQGDTRLIFESDVDEVLVESEIETRLSAVELKLVANEQAAELTGSLFGAAGLSAVMEVRLEKPLTSDGALRGLLQAKVPDIGELRALVDRYVFTEALVGELLIDIQLGGTRAAPTLDGGATLRDGRATVPLFGITVVDIDVAVSAGDDDNLLVKGSAQSGEGVIDLSGVIGLSPETGVFADIGVTGERFQLLRLPDLTAFVSPDLTAHFDQGLLEVDGRVLVPEAVIEFRELGVTAITTSDDVVIHREGEGSSDAIVNSRIAGSLDFELGDAVTFSGLGLSTRLTGGLLMTFRPGAMPAGEGAFQLVDGTFETFGREMRIERGSLNFYGPLDDPVVDARATRRLRYENQDIKLGINLSGRISQQLEFALFSEPAMTEADILSFLVVGRPVSTGDDGAAAGAALALGLQSLSATRRAGESLTLDEVSFEGGGADDTAVVAGKRLGDKWYIRYSYGLFDRVGTFIIRYDIGRGVSVEAGSGAQQSLDLIYSIDR